jgi:IMP dehydrogenase
MGNVSGKISRSFAEYIILPGYTSRKASYDNVDLTTHLAGNVILRYPLIGAAMSCVGGYAMTLACAKNGIMQVVPCSLPIEVQVGIVRDVKKKEVRKGDLELTDDPVMISSLKKTVRDAADLYDEYGHSTIPVCDDYRVLRGIFKHREGIPADVLDMSMGEAISRADSGDSFLGEIVRPFCLESAQQNVDYFWESTAERTIHRIMSDGSMGIAPVIKRGGALVKLAFIYKYNGYAVGGAIHTHEGWQKRAEELIGSGADMIFIDSSHAKTDFQVDAIGEFKRLYGDVPVCAGNIVDAEGYRMLVDAGADLVKIGMGTGGSCITSENRGVGRGIATAVIDVAEERDRNERKVPIIADGGIGARRLGVTRTGNCRISEYVHDPGSIAKALAFADAVMMGTGFNMFEEAAGETRVSNGKRCKERWGEGSRKAATLARYGVGENIRRADIEEGIDDLVTCVGRLKPVTEKIALNVKMTLSNVGAVTLEEYRNKAVVELLSEQALRETGVG